MPATRRTAVGNLPVELTSFVGRRRELKEIKRLLSESPLVTLTGVGGTGKTRLALRAAAELRRSYGDGVWFVDLTQLMGAGLLTQDVGDPGVLAFLVTATLGLREQGDGSPLGMLMEQLAGREMLLVLDNCEHLIPASAVLADALLRGCPDLRVLATSREPLAIAGEVLFAVPPLPAPDLGHRASQVDMRQCESVVLLLSRADAVAPGFRLTEDNQHAVVELCRRLEGLPLAIELAAARIRTLTPEQILDRLTDRFGLLSRGSRAAPERQQTLRGCVEWSFELCAKPERMLWARLAVFAGGFELDAIEEVCADQMLPEVDLLDLVAGLVDKSILVREDVGFGHQEQARYRMLETIREYGLAKLRDAGEEVVLRRRHRDWYQRLAVRADVEWVGPRQAYWSFRLIREQGNLRAAMEFCLTEPGEAEAAMRIMVGLPRGFWMSRGMVSDAEEWLGRALAWETAPTELRARALVTCSALALFQTDTDAAALRLAEGERLAQRLHDHLALALVAYVRAQAAVLRTDMIDALGFAERGLTFLSQAPGPRLALRLHLLLQVVVAAGSSGDYDRAKRSYQEILQATESCGEVAARSYATWGNALAAWRVGDIPEAGRRTREGLRIQRAAELQSPYIAGLLLEILAWTAARQQRHRRAAVLLGAAAGVRVERGRPVGSYHMLEADHDACTAQICDALGDAEFTNVFHEGETLPLDDAIGYAIDEHRQSSPPQSSEASTPLTRRERQVAELIAEGLSNKEIAGRLVISQRTAESHVEHILNKLGFTGRAQVAGWAAARSGDPDS